MHVSICSHCHSRLDLESRKSCKGIRIIIEDTMFMKITVQNGGLEALETLMDPRSEEAGMTSGER